MAQHDLFSPTAAPLQYPHYLIWVDNKSVTLVTNPKNKIVVGDIVFISMRTGPHEVTKVVEERKAKGNHKTKFIPLFQKLNIKLCPRTEN